MAMLNCAVAEKSFAVFTNQGKLDEDLTKTIKPILNADHANELGKRLRKSVIDKPYPTAGSAAKELAKLQDMLRDEVKAHGTFRVGNELITKLAVTIQGKRIQLKSRAIHRDNPTFAEFTESLPDKAKTVLQRGINGHQMLAVDIEADNARVTSMLLVDLGDHVWIPSFPDSLEFENGDVLKDFEVEDMFKLLLDEAVPGHKDRGVVNVKGPRGGEQLVGEVFSKKKRDEIKDKEICLENDYKLELYA